MRIISDQDRAAGERDHPRQRRREVAAPRRPKRRDQASGKGQEQDGAKAAGSGHGIRGSSPSSEMARRLRPIWWPPAWWSNARQSVVKEKGLSARVDIGGLRQ